MLAPVIISHSMLEFHIIDRELRQRRRSGTGNISDFSH